VGGAAAAEAQEAVAVVVTEDDQVMPPKGLRFAFQDARRCYPLLPFAFLCNQLKYHRLALADQARAIFLFKLYHGKNSIICRLL